jgi:membrane fusion protein (multidrug efflux system)
MPRSTSHLQRNPTDQAEAAGELNERVRREPRHRHRAVRSKEHRAPHRRRHRGKSSDERRKEHHTPDEDHRESKSESNNDSPPLYKRPWFIVLMIVAAVIVLAAALGYWWYSRHYEWTDDAFIDGHVVQIAPKVAGYVVLLAVDDNQLVEAGDLVLEIDPRDFQTALERAEAAELSALERLRQTDSQIAAAEAQARAAEADEVAAAATAVNASRQKQRNELLAPHAVSQETLETSIAQSEASSAQELAAGSRANAAAAEVALARAQRATAAASLAEAQAQVRESALNLSYCKLYAPVRGRVTHRSVEQGDYVQPGRALFALVEPDIWVTANFKETQLTHMRPGQPVEIRVDAYPHHVLHGHVDSFQRGSGARFSLLPAENATGNYVKVVQRIPVKLLFDDQLPGDMILGPGMSVVPTVTVR